MNVEIKKLEISINKLELSITIEEAKELYDELGKIFAAPPMWLPRPGDISSTEVPWWENPVTYVSTSDHMPDAKINGKTMSDPSQ